MTHVPAEFVLNRYDCGCEVNSEFAGGAGGKFIKYCAMHTAAPEMLEALERALDWIPGINECCDDEREELGQLQIDIKAAIRKAKEPA